MQAKTKIEKFKQAMSNLRAEASAQRRRDKRKILSLSKQLEFTKKKAERDKERYIPACTTAKQELSTERPKGGRPSKKLKITTGIDVGAPSLSEAITAPKVSVDDSDVSPAKAKRVPMLGTPKFTWDERFEQLVHFSKGMFVDQKTAWLLRLCIASVYVAFHKYRDTATSSCPCSSLIFHQVMVTAECPSDMKPIHSLRDGCSRCAWNTEPSRRGGSQGRKSQVKVETLSTSLSRSRELIPTKRKKQCFLIKMMTKIKWDRNNQ